eukprot:1502410-Amphidinium_carterae.2
MLMNKLTDQDQALRKQSLIPSGFSHWKCPSMTDKSPAISHPIGGRAEWGRTIEPNALLVQFPSSASGTFLSPLVTLISSGKLPLETQPVV